MSSLPAQRIRVTKRFHFEMAHALHGHDGACAHVHGHSYALEVTVIGFPIVDDRSPKNGMVIDFADLEQLVHEEVIARFDHALLLNDAQRESFDPGTRPLFARVLFTPYQPTCEDVLHDIAARLAPRLPTGVALRTLRLAETPTSHAEWHASDNA